MSRDGKNIIFKLGVLEIIVVIILLSLLAGIVIFSRKSKINKSTRNNK